jgi:hypothetical protein
MLQGLSNSCVHGTVAAVYVLVLLIFKAPLFQIIKNITDFYHYSPAGPTPARHLLFGQLLLPRRRYLLQIALLTQCGNLTGVGIMIL